MLVRSGSEPPVLCAAGSTEGFSSWSGDGKILENKKREGPRKARLVLLESLWQCLSFQLHSAVFRKIHLRFAISVARHPSSRRF